MTFSDDEDPTPSASLQLTLRTAGIGCRSITLAEPGEQTYREVPFKLGPLEGVARLTTPPYSTTRRFEDGRWSTAWSLDLRPDGDGDGDHECIEGWTPADLFEAFGVEVNR